MCAHFGMIRGVEGKRRVPNPETKKHHKENITVATRNGKHRDGNVRMGIYVAPFRKAVALLAAKECEMTMTDVIWSGIETIAKSRGILDADGKVSKEFQAQYNATLAIVRQAEVNG